MGLIRSLRVMCLLLALFFIPMMAQAGERASPFTLLGVSPSPAMAFEPVQAVFMFNGCGGWGVDHTIRTDGNTITLAHQAHDFCGVGLPPRQVRFELGALPAGSYTLVYEPGGAFAPQSINFLVQSPPVTVPASSITTLGVLIALVLMLALRTGLQRIP